jgi:3-oxoacyl-[acyl-carrier protein] reductase
MGKIVVTGASSEIGLAIARRLSGLGRPMLLQYHRNKPALDLPGLEFVQADFADPASVDAFLERLQDVEILVNAAAETQTGLLPQLEDDQIGRMLAVNVVAVTRICRAVIPQMCLRRRGVIVNLSSVTATRVFRGQSVYGGTKAYIETFTKAIAAECAKKGVRCNCVAPGSIESGSLKKLLTTTGSDVLKDVNASAHFGTPEDVAEAVAYLCSDGSRYVNGTVLHLDGGYWLGI